MAATITYAKTMARMDAIKITVGYLLRLAGGLSEYSMNNIDRILDDKAANTFHVYGFNSSKLCRAQLDLSIDWDEYGIQINSGKSYVALDTSVDEGVSIEVVEMVRVFDKFIKTNSLNREYRVTFCYGVDFSKYGFETGSSINWHGERQTLIPNLDIPELSELRLGLYASY